MYLGSWKIDDLLTFTIVTTRVDTGAATDADSAPAYRVYEDETATPILTGTMSLLDGSNTAGFYSEQITLSAANGFERGKSYNIYIQATVNSVVGATTRNFQIAAPVDLRYINGGLTDGYNATLKLKQLDIQNSAGDAIKAEATGGNGSGIRAIGVGTGDGMRLNGGGSGLGAYGGSGTGQNGISAIGGQAGAGIYGAGGGMTGAGTGNGMLLIGGSEDRSGVGHGMQALGSGSDQAGLSLIAAAGPGLRATGGGNGGGLEAFGAGNGYGMYALAGASGGDGIGAFAQAAGFNGIEAGADGASGSGILGYGKTAGIKGLGVTNGDGVVGAKAGTGVDIRGNLTGNITGTLATVTTLTNAPPDSSGVTTLLSRIPAALFAGITSLAQWLGLLGGKQAGNATARTELNATGAGSGTYDETTDSNQALRDRGDAAWITATGFSTLDAAGVRSAVGLASANLDTQLDALPTNAELATALGTADDAVLAAIAALNNLSAAGAQTAAAAALAAYDAATGADVAAIPAAPSTADIADKVLIRNLAGGSDGGRTVQDALRVLRNKRSIAAGTLTVTEEDDTTPAWTAAVATAASDPINSVDPS